MERNPYSPPSALVGDVTDLGAVKTPWGGAAGFYWAFLWRATLISTGLCLPFFFAIFPVLKLVLDAWPLFEGLLRLACILVIFVIASCLAISWAVQSNFRGYWLRILDSRSASDSSPLSLPDNIPMTRAARLFGAHLWRYVLVVLPVNAALMWLLVGPAALKAGGWVAVLKSQSINLSVGFLVGIWAMREALSVAYPGFTFQWVVADSRVNPNLLEARPSPSVERNA